MPMCVCVYANAIALIRHMYTSPLLLLFRSVLRNIGQTTKMKRQPNLPRAKMIHIYLKALHRCREVSNEMLSHCEGEYQLRTNDHELGSEAFEECTSSFVLQQIGDNANSRLG